MCIRDSPPSLPPSLSPSLALSRPLSPSAMCSTDIAFPARQRVRYWHSAFSAMCSTGFACSYAVCGTDVGYGGLRVR
eukprot:262629-Rhodomonas_salina.1